MSRTFKGIPQPLVAEELIATDIFLADAEDGRNARNILKLVTQQYNDAWVISRIYQEGEVVTLMHFGGDKVRVHSSNAFGMVVVDFIDGYTDESDTIFFPQGFPAEVIAQMVIAGFSAFTLVAERG